MSKFYANNLSMKNQFEVEESMHQTIRKFLRNYHEISKNFLPNPDIIVGIPAERGAKYDQQHFSGGRRGVNCRPDRGLSDWREVPGIQILLGSGRDRKSVV